MKKIIYWSIRIFPAIITLQTLFFKFCGATESIAIFSKIGIEPYGRIGTGVVELFASILILLPKYSRFGALLGAGTMFGAIVTHLFILGIEVNNDKGQLFFMALITFFCCVIILFDEQNKFSKFQKRI